MKIDVPRILLVEDDRAISELLSQYLLTNSCEIKIAENGREMDRVLAEASADLIVLDLMLPGEDGLSLCRRLRASSNIPIVMLTARGDEIDRIVGLEMGADDYLAKPFSPRELLARIRAVLRRHPSVHTGVQGAVLEFLGWSLDMRKRELRDPEGALVAVTSAEFDLLQAFCEKPGRVLGRDNLLDLTYGRSTGSFERSIDVLVSRLRRKLERGGASQSRIIQTIRSGGYMFTPVVTSA